MTGLSMTVLIPFSVIVIKMHFYNLSLNFLLLFYISVLKQQLSYFFSAVYVSLIYLYHRMNHQESLFVQPIQIYLYLSPKL